jgi:MYXO-CTERM domain-containing protein
MSILKTLLRSLTARTIACSILVAAAPVQAAVVASFDPAFGPGIPNLGFRGSVTFDVSAACYAAGPGVVATNPYDANACQITPTSGEVDFYDTRDLSRTTLTAVSVDFSNFYVIDGFFDFVNDTLQGLDTEDSFLFEVSVPTVGYDGLMVLYFTTPFSDIDPAFLRNCTGASSLDDQCNDDAQSSNPAIVTFRDTNAAAVPEPDSVALAVIGLGALIVGRRRRGAPTAR